jgi:iron complex transport system substrate-binding protein
MRARVERVRRQLPKRRPSAIFVISLEPLWAAGRDTFADEMMTLAGARNALAAAFSGFKAVSLETVLGGAPEVILLAGPKADAVLGHPRWQRTPAAKNRRVYELNPDWVLRESPRSVNGLEQIAECVRQRA